MFNFTLILSTLVLKSRACERSVSGAENGAEQAENGMSGSGAQAKSAAQSPLTLTLR